MVNSQDFIERLQKVIAYYGHSASSFADKIGVQRSGISHVLSGRNKPSLEFVMKVLSSFPEVDLYWLLNGKGTFPSEVDPVHIPNPGTKHVSDRVPLAGSEDSDIDRIIIFFKDGSFKNFKN